MNRVGVLLLICSVGVVFSGCTGSSSVEREVRFGEYVFSLSEEYVEVSPALVENKQLINKVIWSYKIPAEVKGTFEPNVIITRSDLSPDLNFEQFWTLNAQKLNANLAGYQPGSKEVFSFVCGDRTVQWLLVYFRLQDPWYTANPEVRMAQYQFVDQQKWYIISAVYMTEQEQKQFVDIVESFGCVDTTVKTAW